MSVNYVMLLEQKKLMTRAVQHPDSLESAHKCSSRVSANNGGAKKCMRVKSIAIYKLCKAKVKYVGNTKAI